MAMLLDCNRKDLRLLLISINWTIWWETNTRIFGSRFLSSQQVVALVECEATSWMVVVPRQLATLLSSLPAGSIVEDCFACGWI